MKEIPANSKFGSLVLFATGPVSFFILGYHATCLGPVIPALKFMYNQSYYERNGSEMPETTWLLLLSLTMSFIIVGALLGGTGSKLWLAILTRKHLFQVCHLFNIAGILTMSLVGGVTWSYEAVIVGRFLSGFPCGVFFALIPACVAETSAKAEIPAWQSYGGISVTVGSLLGASLAHPKALGNASLWWLLLAFNALPSVFYLASSFFFPETPFYLVRKLRLKEAAIVLRKLRKANNSTIETELNEIQEEVNKSPKVVESKELFTTKQYRNQTLTVMALTAGLMLSGANNFVLYMDEVFLQAQIDPEIVTFCTIGVFALEVVAGILGTSLLVRIGGTRMNIAANIVVVFALSLFTVSQAASSLAPTVMPYIAIASVAIFMVGVFGGYNLSTLVLLGDLTIEPTRPTALAYSSCMLWICSWFVGFIPPYLQISLGPYSMTPWLGASILFLIFQLVYLPEIKNKTSDEIQAHFK